MKSNNKKTVIQWQGQLNMVLFRIIILYLSLIETNFISFTDHTSWFEATYIERVSQH